MKNEMLEEIWAARQRIARKNGYNLRRTVNYLRGLKLTTRTGRRLQTPKTRSGVADSVAQSPRNPRRKRSAVPV